MTAPWKPSVEYQDVVGVVTSAPYWSGGSLWFGFTVAGKEWRAVWPMAPVMENGIRTGARVLLHGYLSTSVQGPNRQLEFDVFNVIERKEP